MNKNQARALREWPQDSANFIDPIRDHVSGNMLKAPWRGMLSIEPRDGDKPITGGPLHFVLQFDLGRTKRHS